MMLFFQRFAHLLYWLLLFVLVHALDFVERARIFLRTIFCDGQTVRGYATDDNLSGKWTTANVSAPPLRHIAFHLDDRQYINEAFVRSLIRHCARAGIIRLTLSDSWSLLLGTMTPPLTHANDSVDDQCSTDSSGKRTIIQTTAAVCQNGCGATTVVVRRLAHDEGRTATVRACQKLSMSQSPVTSAEQLKLISTGLITDDGSADEQQSPDFLVRVGGSAFWRSVTLAAHSPLAIRTTEFHSVDGFSSDQMLSDQEFHALLDQFSARSRRFGR